jgi:hypothetical protein
MGVALCTMVQKCVSPKKRLTKMVIVYELSILVKEEKEIPYSS